MVKERTGIGVAVAIAVLCALAALITAAREPGPLLPSFSSDARTERQCSGARLTLIVHVGDPARGALVVADPRSRTWHLAWSGHGGPQSLRATPTGGRARTVFTDLDEGTSVQARAAGARSACLLSVDLLAD